MRKAVLLSLLAIGLMAGGSAITMDTVLDYSCSATMVSWINPACAPVLADDISGNSAKTVQDEVYKAGLFINDNRKQVLTEKNSRLNQTYGMAISDAKITAIESLNSGKSLSKAKSLATGDVEDYYSLLQQSVITYENRNLLKLNASINKIQSTGGLSCGAVFSAQQFDSQYANAKWKGVACDDFRINKTNKTLYNGSEVTRYSLEVRIVSQADPGTKWRVFTGQKTYPIASISGIYKEPVLRVKDGSGNFTSFYDAKSYTNYFQNLQNTQVRSYDNALSLVEQIYGGYEPGQVNTSEVLGPLEALQQASTSYSDTGYYSYLSASLEQMGLASEDSYAFKLQWQNKGMSSSKTATGQLFVANEDFSETLKTETQYNAEGKTAWFVHATETGSAQKTSLNGDFTILEMTNTKTGESINSTTVQSNKFRTTTIENLSEQIQELKERQKDWFNGLSGGGSGGGSSSGILDGFISDLADQFGIDKAVMWLIGIIVVLLIAMVLLWK